MVRDRGLDLLAESLHLKRRIKRRLRVGSAGSKLAGIEESGVGRDHFVLKHHYHHHCHTTTFIATLLRLPPSYIRSYQRWFARHSQLAEVGNNAYYVATPEGQHNKTKY
jgi:hypothetical protein